MTGRWSRFEQPPAPDSAGTALVIVGAEAGESNRPGLLSIGAVILGALVVRHMVKK